MMDSKNIEIKLDDKTLICIGGRDFGKELYNKFIKDTVNEDYYKLKNISDTEKYKIVFPNFVEDIAISFVKGFVEEMLVYIDEKSFFDYFEISGNEDAMNDFREGIFY